jgi:Phage integrase family
MLPSEQHRTVVLLLAMTGVRVSSVTTLRRDAFQLGSDGHPYLRYLNVKLRREAALPIGPALCEQLRRQESYLEAIYGPEGTSLLIPSPPAGKRGTSCGGAHPLSEGMIRQIVKRYVRKAEIRDSQGRLASWVHPHLFRHHLGTSLVNEKLPLPVIRKVLDHDSVAMTTDYAHVHDETVQLAMTRRLRGDAERDGACSAGRAPATRRGVARPDSHRTRRHRGRRCRAGRGCCGLPRRRGGRGVSTERTHAIRDAAAGRSLTLRAEPAARFASWTGRTARLSSPRSPTRPTSAAFSSKATPSCVPRSSSSAASSALCCHARGGARGQPAAARRERAAAPRARARERQRSRA